MAGKHVKGKDNEERNEDRRVSAAFGGFKNRLTKEINTENVEE